MCSLAEFETVLKNLTSPDNNVRAQAEQLLDASKSNANWLVPALLELSKGSQDPVVAHMSVVLLRRYISKTSDSLFDGLVAETQAHVKTQLLARIAEPQPGPIRKGLAHCVSGLGCQLMATQWPELLPTLFGVLQSGAPEAQATVLLIFASLAPHFTDEMLATQASPLKEMCSFALQQSPIDVKIAAVETAMEMVTYLKDKQHVEAFQQLLPMLIAAVGQALRETNWAAAEKGVQSFIAVAEVAPEFFSKHLKEVFAPFLEMTSSSTLDCNLRRLAFEFTITVAENDPKTVKKVPQYLTASVPLAMQLQLDLDHDEDWGATPEEEEDEATNFDFGVEALDRLAMALGGKKMHPVVSPLVMQYVQSDDWKYRNAGLWSLSQVAEGCAKDFKPLLPQIVPIIVKGFDDPHERVRHAAITCMAQFCTEYGPDLQAKYHSALLPLVMKRMSDVPRVASQAAKACINFMAGAEREDTESYLDALLTTMLQQLQASQHRFVSEDIVSAITAIATHAEELFEKYYSTIMPWLKTVITAANVPKADRMLRAKALECLGRVAVAVGKERFSADAPEVLEAMQRMQTSAMECDDPAVAYLMRAWGRMAECLGADLGQYYHCVLPALIRLVESKTDITITDEEGQDTEEGVQSLTLALKGLGDKRISIKTSALEEKTLACAVLSQMLESGYQVLFSYVEPLVPVVVPLLRFAYVEEVREDAAGIMPSLLKSVKHHESSTPAMVSQLAQHLTSSMVEAIKLEPSSSVKSSQLQALSACMEEAPTGSLGEQLVATTCALTQKVLTDGWAARDKLRRERRECDDEDEEEQVDAEMENEEEAMCQSLDVLTTLLKQEPCFMPNWESTFFPQFTALLNKGLFETRLALCALACFVEYHAQGAAAPHLPNMAQAMMEQCHPGHDDPDVVQVAAYGLARGLAHGACFAPFAPAAVERLTAVVQGKGADEDWDSAVCNAVAGLLEAQEHQQNCPGETIFPLVIPVLPVKGDEEEGQRVHRRIVSLLQAGDAALLGPGGCHQATLQAACKAMRTSDCVDAETKAKVKAMGC